MMNKKQLIIIPALGLLFFSANSYAALTKIDWDKLGAEKEIKQYENKKYKTRDEYKEAYYQKKCSSVWLWMHLDKETKIALIDALKGLFKERNNITIKKPAEFYVKAIDSVISNDIMAVNYKLVTIFTTIAVMEGDFNKENRLSQPPATK